MKEFVALAKANPDKFNFSTPPIGTTPQLQLEVLKSRENLPKLADVVFKGGGDAITALLSGTVQLSSGSLAPAPPHIKAGTLRCLAVTGETRWPDLPDVPTMQEAGYKDFVFATDMALLAPAKTPPEVVKWLEKETLKVLRTPEMKEKLYKAGFQVRPKGADVPGRGYQGNRHVQGHHRQGRNQEDVARRPGVARAAVNIKSIEPIAVSLPMLKPVIMAGEEVRRADNVLVRIEADNGLVGWGEAASAPIMTGETLESIVAAVHYLEPALRGRDRRRHRRRARRHGRPHVRQSRRQGGDRDRAARSRRPRRRQAGARAARRQEAQPHAASRRRSAAAISTAI